MSEPYSKNVRELGSQVPDFLHVCQPASKIVLSLFFPICLFMLIIVYMQTLHYRKLQRLQKRKGSNGSLIKELCKKSKRTLLVYLVGIYWQGQKLSCLWKLQILAVLWVNIPRVRLICPNTPFVFSVNSSLDYHTKIFPVCLCGDLTECVCHCRLWILYRNTQNSPKTKKRKTSWPNARVKLHSQVHFGSRNILSTKNCWVQKNVSSEIFLCPTRFWVQRIVKTQRNSTQLNSTKATQKQLRWVRHSTHLEPTTPPHHPKLFRHF